MQRRWSSVLEGICKKGWAIMQLRDAIRHNLAVLKRRFWFLLISVSLCTGIVLVVSLSQPPTYQAAALVMVNGTGNDVYSNQALALSYSLLVTSDDVLQAAAPHLPGVRVERLRQAVSDSTLAGTQIIEIRAQGNSPQQAALIANVVTSTFIQLQTDKELARLQMQEDLLAQKIAQAKNALDASQAQLANLQKAHASTEKLNQQRTLIDSQQGSYNALLESERQLQQRKMQNATLLTVAQRAAAPAQPLGPHVAMNTLVAALLSLLMLTCLIMLIDWLDTTIYSSEDVAQQTGLEAPGTLPLIKNAAGMALLTNPRMEKAFTQIGTRIDQPDANRRVYLLTGVRSSNGVSLASVGLARTFAQAGLRVLLIDANQTHPTLHETFGCSNVSGLTDCLATLSTVTSSPKENWLAQWETTYPNLWLLPAGNPSLTIGAFELRMFIHWLLHTVESTQARAIDMIIFDAPPFAQNPALLALASVADTALLLIEAGKEQRDTVNSIQLGLQHLGLPLLGVIVNHYRSRKQKAPVSTVVTVSGLPTRPLANKGAQQVIEQVLPPILPRLPETPIHLERVIAPDLLQQTALIDQEAFPLITAILPAIEEPEERSPAPTNMDESRRLPSHLRGISLPGLGTEGTTNRLKLRSYMS
jgi:capsular polysaccharide biosynthesis protein/MinD-like ATPase involved in chromosome partitioning or flagellar assembly